MERAESILEELRETLVPMIDAIRESDADLAVDTFEGTFPEAEQEALARETLELVGYDFDRGRPTSPRTRSPRETSSTAG